MNGSHTTCEDGRNPVGVAGRVRGGAAHETQGCSNPGLNDGTPLALGRNPVGVAGRVRGGAAHETQGCSNAYQGCSNPSLNYGTPLALKKTKPKGLEELSPGFAEPWVVCREPTIHCSSGNPNGVASIAA